ncbi:hypothetical protein GCM10023210_36020 [Chryseobacterium ginsengisoli]|uniref:DUF3575 domain-containing protein n=1 Tax=Chryseobacterium ginsengisoli TaxID=363853 RepID=A0ABP9MNU4_9FLAO
MKKKLILICLIFSSVMYFSQEANEVKIDAFGLFFNRIGVGYERIFSQNSTVGARFLMKKTENYYAVPFYRYYFQEDAYTYATDLFLEGFAMYESYIPRDSEENLLDGGKRNSIIAAGLGIGEKADLSSGFFAEALLNAGVGKVLQPTSGSDYQLVIQISASVGYRF